MEIEQYREQLDEMLRAKQRLMQGHNKDLEERDAMIERMQISHEELIAKKEKEKAILKQRLEEADLHLARSQKEA